MESYLEVLKIRDQNNEKVMLVPEESMLCSCEDWPVESLLMSVTMSSMLLLNSLFEF